MSKRREIETIKIGGKNFYNMHKYLKNKNIIIPNKIRRKICYCRVSSSGQKRRFNKANKTCEKIISKI